MGGVVRAHYLMCEYLITKNDMGLKEDRQDRSPGQIARTDQQGPTA
jgi:hypothetical protein